MHQIHNVLSDVGSVWIKKPKRRCRLTVLVTSLESRLVHSTPNPRHVKFHYHTDTGLCHRQASTQECELQATFLKLRNTDTFSICKTFKAHNPRWYRSSAKLLSPGRMLSNFGGASVSPSTSFRMVSLSGSPIWIASDKPKASWTTASIGIWRAKWRPQSWTWLLVSKESKDNAGIANNLNFFFVIVPTRG